MPAPARVNHALACTSGFIYVIGGTDDTTTIANVDRYDILNDSWSTVAIPAMSLARTGAAAAIDRWGRIWVAGGTDSSSADTSSVEIFDPGRPALGWVAGPAMNVPRKLHGLVVDPKGTLWALGGSSGSSHVNSIESIDACGAVAWTTSASVIPNPVSQTDYGALGADGQVYVAGGWLPGMSNRVLRFDPVTTLWETCQALNQPLNHVRLVLGTNNRVFRIGGEPGAGSSVATVESLDTGQFCAPSGVPAISAAGLAVFSLLILAAGTIVMRARRLPSGADRL
jgi:hypothetical protein